jgi:hypothetical protein
VGNLAVGTIAAKNYLSFARVLARSFHAHHPDVPFFLVLVEEVDGAFDPATEPFHLVGLASLAIPQLRRVCFRSSRQELAVTAKPHLLRHLLGLGFSQAFFLDPDVFVVGDLSPLFAAAERHAIVLTPHLLEPLTGPDRIARELNILQAGIYNAGCLGISNTPPGHQFLDWWQARVHAECRNAIGRSVFYDQRWLDFVPVFFENAGILREPGFNVAYWNLPERDLQIDDGTVLVDGLPAGFVHFSGIDPEQPNRLSRYTQRVALETLGPVRALFERYVSQLAEAGYHVSRNWGYAFDSFDNGIPIPDIARRLYRDLGDEVDSFGDPFQTSPSHSYFNWLNQPVDPSPDQSRRVTRLWEAVYQRSRDLQRKYPDIYGTHRDAFLDWTAQFGHREHGIPHAF